MAYLENSMAEVDQMMCELRASIGNTPRGTPAQRAEFVPTSREQTGPSTTHITRSRPAPMYMPDEFRLSSPFRAEFASNPVDQTHPSPATASRQEQFVPTFRAQTGPAPPTTRSRMAEIPVYLADGCRASSPFRPEQFGSRDVLVGR